MTRSNFPYLTPAVLQEDADSILANAAILFPAAAGYVRVLEAVLPFIVSAAAAKQLLQSICDEINAITGAVAPAA